MTFTIVLLALVAAFLGLRLYSVLGKRTGHEQEPVTRQPLDAGAPVIRQPVAMGESAPALPQGDMTNVELAAQSGLRAIELLQMLAHQQERAVVIVTHDPKVAASAERVVAMSDGKIVSDRHAAH